jgi:hypothetical protein
MICRTLESSKRRKHGLYISSVLALTVSSIIAVSIVAIIVGIISNRITVIAVTIATCPLLYWGIL